MVVALCIPAEGFQEDSREPRQSSVWEMILETKNPLFWQGIDKSF